jgi:peptidoglycan L-alanyl-D-glutamate endopeptidase CwlK
MPAFGTASAARLATCDQRLQDLMNEVVKTFDCTVIEGHRGEAAQHLAFVTGKSKLDWPNGNHNAKPSKACDVAPYPVDWTDAKEFYYFAGFVKGVAAKMGLNVRWGGDWNQDNKVKDNTFNDLVHFEIKE